MPQKAKVTGLVLPAGGARAAYQVGVLKYIGEKFPEVQPQVFSGISAGCINSTFLAQGEKFSRSTTQLYDLWAHLTFDQVLRTQFSSLFSMAARWMYDLFLSKVTRKLLFKSFLDASPLANTILTNLHFWKVAKAIRQGDVLGVAVTTTNYHNGTSTIFFDSHLDVRPWVREHRTSVRTAIKLKHIMASCSIPILFEPVRLGDYFHGDGSLRFNFPFSPAIQLGANRILAIGIRCPNPENPHGKRPEQAGLGFVAGAVLNSIFLDTIEADYENLRRINRLRDKNSSDPLEGLLLRPSRDLGAIAKSHLDEVPFHFRQLLRSTANPQELGDLLSYLMFSPGYVGELLKLGYEDGKAQHELLANFFNATPPAPVTSTPPETNPPPAGS